MAIAAPLIAPQVLTYQDYLNEGEVNKRYDIIDGVRVFMTQPSVGHQEVALNIAELLRAYQRQRRRGRTIIAPCDVLISYQPLKTRQPDVLFISRERYGDRVPQDALPLSPAPEIAIEVLSPSETRTIREGKIIDYCSVDVKECWIVNMEAQTVEVLRLTPDGPGRAALYASCETLQSITFDDLTIALDDIFRIEE